VVSNNIRRHLDGRMMNSAVREPAPPSHVTQCITTGQMGIPSG